MNPVHCIAKQFAPALINITPLGNGLINDTYLVVTDTQRLVLQKINRQVFPRPELIMANLSRLSEHVGQASRELTQLVIPELLKTTAGANYYLDDHNDYWRALSYIDQTESLETIRTLADAEQAGAALGCFHCLVSDLNPDNLHDTLPGFHIAPDYLTQYQQILAQPTCKPDADCATFINEFHHLVNDLENAKQQGLLRQRIIHGDPKLNNFLFDKRSRQVVSLIDLDTVKPGLVHYDIADCLRSCCHNPDTDRFQLDVCEAILKSYLREVGSFFSEHDYRYLYPAIRLIPFELGLRFYTDYLAGNRYFKVSEPQQNLQRAAQQFRLCADIIAGESAINSLIARLRTQLDHA
ncbi:MAG: aminoglycoside phosphotransferase family protein [Methylococcales bacterium]